MNRWMMLAMVAGVLAAGSADASLDMKTRGPASGPSAGGVAIGVPDGRVRIQCWQDGRRVVDESDAAVVSLGIASHLDALRFSRADGAGAVMSLVPLARTICLLAPQG